MPGSGGGKTSSSTSQTSSPFAPMLAQEGRALFKEGNPIISALSRQMLSAIQTGGVNAQIPMINRSVDSARASSTTTNQQLQESLAKAGLQNTSFGQAIMAQTQEQSGENISQIPTDITSQFISGAPGLASGATGQGIGALGVAGGLDTSTKGTQTPSFWDFFNRSLEAGGIAGGGLNFGTI